MAPIWYERQNGHFHHIFMSTSKPFSTNSFFRMKPERSTLKIAAADEAEIQIATDRMPSSKALADVCNVNLVSPECLRTLYGTHPIRHFETCH